MAHKLTSVYTQNDVVYIYILILAPGVGNCQLPMKFKYSAFGYLSG